MFVRLLAFLVFLGAFAGAQAPAPATSNTQSDEQQKTSNEVNTSSEHGTKLNLPTTPVAPARGLEKIGNGVSAPVAIKTPQAKYAKEAREKKIEGACLVSIIVDANGIPQNLRMVRPIGHGLDEAALAAVKKYRFRPAKKDGRPVAVQIIIEVNFKLY